MHGVKDVMDVVLGDLRVKEGVFSLFLGVFQIEGVRKRERRVEISRIEYFGGVFIGGGFVNNRGLRGVYMDGVCLRC